MLERDQVKRAIDFLKRAKMGAGVKDTLRPYLTSVTVESGEDSIRIEAFDGTYARVDFPTGGPEQVATVPMKWLADRAGDKTEGAGFVLEAVPGHVDRWSIDGFWAKGLEPERRPRFEPGVRLARLNLEKGWTAAGELVVTHGAKDFTRPHLYGLALIREGTGMYFAATDGHRLAVVPAPVSGSDPMQLNPADEEEEYRRVRRPNELILPHWNNGTMLEAFARDKGLAKGEARLDVFQIPNPVPTKAPPPAWVCITASDADGVRFTLARSLVAAMFPPFTQVIPETFHVTARVSRAEVLRAIDRVSKVEGVNGMRFTAGEGHLRVSALCSEGGGFDTRIQSDGPWVTSSLGVGVNHVYLREALEVWEGHETISLGAFNVPDDKAPERLMVWGSGAYDRRHVCVIMPMKP